MEVKIEGVEPKSDLPIGTAIYLRILSRLFRLIPGANQLTYTIIVI